MTAQDPISHLTESLLGNLPEEATYGEKTEAIRALVKGGHQLNQSDFVELVREINGTGDWKNTFSFKLPDGGTVMRKSPKKARGLARVVGACYQNALTNYKTKGLRVAFGLAFCESMNHIYMHAWNLDESGMVLDPTWDAIPVTGQYFGVVLNDPGDMTDVQLEALVRRHCWLSH